ncbi:MAG TPA: amidohydrolase [Gemmatimonadaceae bacterium]|jgi:amidohydrolase
MRLAILLALTTALPLAAQAPSSNVFAAEIDRRAAQVNDSVVAWRRDIHQHPELSGQETRTAALVAAHLRRFGIETRTGIGGTGVVGVLKGGRPGPVVALRADMDALPVTEDVDVPFRSHVRTQYNGQEVGVMHACGHDNHVAMLLGAAEVLSGMRERLPGTVVFLFQPAEESLGGAAGMIRDGALENPKPSAVFGLHVFPYTVGSVVYRPGGLMAAGGTLRIVVRGRQTHGAIPWNGVDPIVVASQIVLGLQTVVSRQIDLTASPAIVTVATINGGVRNNIIPDSVVMTGTIRTFDEAQRQQIPQLVKRTAESIAAASGATAAVEASVAGTITYNDPSLVERMRPTVERVVGAGIPGAKVLPGPPTTTSEDFSLYQQKVPGIFMFLGITPEGTDPKLAAPNHSPKFFADERALPIGVKLLTSLAVDYLSGAGASANP